MASNHSVRSAALAKAKSAKQDEFYTQKHFQGKTVYLNCDDPRLSNFFHYFSYNFERLGLKKLIAACYKSQEVDLFTTEDSEQAIWLEYEGDKNGSGVPDLNEIGVNYFEGDGGFESAESIELLKQADIVVTNPPFSMFREYIGQLMEHEKQFVVLGNMNAVTYKEIFPLFQQNRIWYGPSIRSGDREFGVPDDYPLTAASSRVDATGQKFVRVKGVRWFTNLDYPERHEEMILFKSVSEGYETYVNFDAIEVPSTNDIPADYDGIMGVPISFLDKYNPDQFEIVGNSDDMNQLRDLGVRQLGREWVEAYRSQGGTGHYSHGMRMLGLTKPKHRVVFKRILIRRKGASA